MPPSQSKLMNPWIAGLIGFVLGILATGSWSLEAKLAARDMLPAPAPAPAATAPSTATSTLATPSRGIISVMDQPAGSSVAVDSVSVNGTDIWVAVEEIRDNELGNVLGATLIAKSATGITVPLLRATAPGTTYAVVLYRDDGDRTFDLAHDSVYVDFDSGERVVALFKTLL